MNTVCIKLEKNIIAPEDILGIIFILVVREEIPPFQVVNMICT